VVEKHLKILRKSNSKKESALISHNEAEQKYGNFTYCSLLFVTLFYYALFSFLFFYYGYKTYEAPAEYNEILNARPECSYYDELPNGSMKNFVYSGNFYVFFGALAGVLFDNIVLGGTKMNVY